MGTASLDKDTVGNVSALSNGAVRMHVTILNEHDWLSAPDCTLKGMEEQSLCEISGEKGLLLLQSGLLAVREVIHPSTCPLKTNKCCFVVKKHPK